MRRGGLYDQLGGGFHRYSVDKKWQVPHFEKMLYDNAALPPVYLAAYQLTGDETFAETVRGTLAYVLREMTAPEGGFYAAQDADSEGEEGRFFVWRPEQLAAVLGVERGRLLAEHLGVTATGNFEGGTTVLQLAKTADELGVSQAELDKAKAELLATREKRVKPFRDEKIITGWNGLMISALAQAGRVLGEASYVEAARRAAAFVLTHLKNRGELYRHYMQGRAHGTGYLEDYANLTAALLDLYEATFEEAYLDEALALGRKTLELFWSGTGAFHLTPAHGEGLLHRPYDYWDDATPSGTAVAVNNLLRLQAHADDAAFREVPEQIFNNLGRVLQSAQGGAGLLLAYDLATHGPTEITLAEPSWAASLAKRYLPRLVLKAGPVTTVCKNYTCSPPLKTYEELEARL